VKRLQEERERAVANLQTELAHAASYSARLEAERNSLVSLVETMKQTMARAVCADVDAAQAVENRLTQLEVENSVLRELARVSHVAESALSAAATAAATGDSEATTSNVVAAKAGPAVEANASSAHSQTLSTSPSSS
jgi:hypothetical protein